MPNIKKYPEPLLIVDDREAVRTSLERFLEMYFDVVLTASDPAGAEEQLRSRKPRYLLTDYWLGNEHPPTTKLIPQWRKLCPTLTHVALMTGTKTSAIEPRPEVDAVFAKPIDLHRLIQFFTEK
jgi:DNA-binding NtrC family response regulator